MKGKGLWMSRFELDMPCMDEFIMLDIPTENDYPVFIPQLGAIDVQLGPDHGKTQFEKVIESLAQDPSQEVIWRLSPLVIDALKEAPKLQVAYSRKSLPKRFQVPHQNEHAAVSRSGQVYLVGSCPCCHQNLEFSVIQTPAAKTTCCDSTLLCGAEVLTCPDENCELGGAAYCHNALVDSGCLYKSAPQYSEVLKTTLVEDLLLKTVGFAPSSKADLYAVRREAMDMLHGLAEEQSFGSTITIQLRRTQWKPFIDPVKVVLSPLPPPKEHPPTAEDMKLLRRWDHLAYIKKLASTPALRPWSILRHSTLP